MIPFTRRTLGVGALVFGLGAGLSAQNPTPEQLQEQYDAKLQEAWFVDGGWTVDFDAAKEKAAETGKPIFAYFSRSYAF